jgi:hypothetical protein
MFTILGVSISAAIGEKVRERLAQEAQILAHGNTALEQEGPDLVDDGGALADQTRTNPMQRLQVELNNTLGGNKAQVGRCTASATGFGVTDIVLLALEEGLHKLRRH